ncbi:hypothetical protein A6U98_13535 [Rhizobium sp. WYCCWR10014]|nr:hypothetical protein A6U98_13535 [Rhizobium sp. WYCCWR10014]
MDARGIDVVELLVSDRIRALPARVERPFCFTALVLVAATCIERPQIRPSGMRQTGMKSFQEQRRDP